MCYSGKKFFGDPASAEIQELPESSDESAKPKKLVAALLTVAPGSMAAIPEQPERRQCLRNGATMSGPKGNRLGRQRRDTHAASAALGRRFHRLMLPRA